MDRIRLFQLALTAWVLMLLTHALYVFTRPGAALERWVALQQEGISRGGAGEVTVVHTAATQMGVDMYAAAVLAVALSALVLALVWRAAHRPDARALAVFLAFLQMPGIVLEAAGLSREAYAILASGLMYVAVAALLRFAALFPHPLTPGDLAGPGRVRAVQRFLVRPAAAWTAAGVLGVSAVAAGVTASALGALVPIGAFGLVMAGVSLLRRSYQVAAPEERRKLLWVVQGFYTGAWVLGVGYAAGMILALRDGVVSADRGVQAVSGATILVMNLTTVLGMLVLLLALAFAVFYHGAIEPGMVIQKTTVYGILTVLGAATFGVVENIASEVVLQTAGLPQSWGGPLAGAFVAAAVTLLRPRVAGWVGRRFPTAVVAAA
jgi:hypothetical protein